MKTPTLEEVRAYFKDAKEVKLINTDIIVDMSDCEIVRNYDTVVFCKNNSIQTDCKHNLLYSFNSDRYAEIISYKSTSNIDLSQITEKFVNELCKDENIKQAFINEKIIQVKETYVQVPMSEIKATKSDKELASLVRSIAENY